MGTWVTAWAYSKDVDAIESIASAKLSAQDNNTACTNKKSRSGGVYQKNCSVSVNMPGYQ